MIRMSSNPRGWDGIPNLSGEAGRIEDVRQGDPSRFFASVRGGQADSVTSRILNMPRVRVTRNTAATVAAATLVTVTWDSDSQPTTPNILHDTDGLWSKARPTEIIAPVDGLWDVFSQWYWGGAALSTSYRQMYFQHLPSGRIFAQSVCPPTSGGGIGTCMSVSDRIPMRAGDSVTVNLAHNDSGPIACNVGSDNCWFGAVLDSTFGSDNG